MNNLKESLISECKILIRRLYYLEKKTNDSRPNNLGHSTPEEEKEVHEKLMAYRKNNMRRNIKIKAYLTRLILLIVHIFHIDQESVEIAKKMLVIPKPKRFWNGNPVDIKNFKDLVKFFRDAICHPEDIEGKPSPRRSVKYNTYYEDLFMNSAFEPHNKDVFFDIGDCRIRLSDIKNFLKYIK